MQSIHKKTLILYIITIIILVIVTGVSLFLFKEMQKRITEVRNVKERVASIQKYESIYREELQKVEKIQESVALLEKEVVTQSAIPIVLSNIEALTAQAGVSGEIISAQIVSQKAKPSYVSIDIKAEGKKEQLITFMKLIEQSKNESSIEKFSLVQGVQTTETRDGGAFWELTATLFVLSYK